MHSTGSGPQMSSQIGVPILHAAEHDRPRRRAGDEDALLVEHAVIGQVDLEPHRFDPAAVEERDGVVQMAVLDPGQADQHRRAAVRGLARERLAGRAAGLLEGRLQHQVLGRIAGEKEFRRQHEVRPEPCRLGARRPQPLRIAGDVADNAGDLGERDDEAVQGRGHDRNSARRAGRRQSPPDPRVSAGADGRLGRAASSPP